MSEEESIKTGKHKDYQYISKLNQDIIKKLQDKLHICNLQLDDLNSRKKDIIMVGDTMSQDDKKRFIDMQIPEIDRMIQQYKRAIYEIIDEIKILQTKQKYLKYKNKYTLLKESVFKNIQ